MSRHDLRSEQLAAERQRLTDAATRLLAGTPQHSDGKLTVSALAVEAGIPRHRLYEHHSEAVAQFKVSAGNGPLTPSQQALKQRLEEALARIAGLEADNALLQRRITTLSAVIAELTHERHGTDIITLPLASRKAPDLDRSSAAPIKNRWSP